MMCHVAEMVLSGGIRRSSLISLFSPSDSEMMYCKTPGLFSFDGVNSQRVMANNSCVLLRGSVSRCEFDRVLRVAAEAYGDPGFIFVDSLEDGTNPCGEIVFLEVPPRGFQFCNLTEVNAVGCDEVEFYARCRAASFLGTLQSSFVDFNYLDPSCKSVATETPLLGVSVSGIMDNPSCVDWMRRGREIIKSENRRVSQLIGVEVAKRTTCVKPSGTASKSMGGISAGVHPRWSRRTVVRVTANPMERLAQEFRAANPHAVEVKSNGDWALCFPIQGPDDGITVRGLSGLEHIGLVHTVYNRWCDGHNVSCTIAVDDEADRAGVVDYIWKYRSTFRAATVVPKMLDTLVPFVPNEAVENEVQEAWWNSLIRLWKRPEYVGEVQLIGSLEPACAGGGCSV
jgi:ribonucleoside-diphosphate reductase alpha chain